MHERTKNTLLALAVALLLLAVVGTIGWQWWGLLSGDWQLPRSEEEARGVATGSGGFGKRWREAGPRPEYPLNRRKWKSKLTDEPVDEDTYCYSAKENDCFPGSEAGKTYVVFGR